LQMDQPPGPPAPFDNFDRRPVVVRFVMGNSDVESVSVHIASSKIGGGGGGGGGVCVCVGTALVSSVCVP
jgi:hypothetical protein